jgi:spore maturation protein CgeB
MHIAFFGSSLVSAYWNGAATYYRGLLKALAERGHAIAFYEPDAFERQAHRDIDDPEWARVVVYPVRPEAAMAAVADAAAADVIVKASGVGANDELLEAAVLRMRGPGRTVIFWDVDAPATLERLAGEPRDPFRALIPEYDLILTYGGGEAVVEGYRRLGAASCVPIYNALDPSTHHPVSQDPCFAADLTFIGNRLPDREDRVREFFLEPARQLPDRRFILAGSGWSDLDLPPNVRAIGHAYTWQHNQLNVSARAVLNVNRASMARFGFSPPTRVFEAAGAGACLITDRWPGIEAFLQPETEILIAGDGAHVVELLETLEPYRARAIGAAARRAVVGCHTYAHRARQVEQVLDTHRAAALAAAG